MATLPEFSNIFSKGEVGDIPVHTPGKLVIGTHGGKFHCDDALSCFLISEVYGRFRDREVIVKRSIADGKDLDDCDIVVDCGMKYDPSIYRFDHHMSGYNEVFSSNGGKVGKGREIKMSAVGLVWRHFGIDILKALWPEDVFATTPEERRRVPTISELIVIRDRIYHSFIASIDANDNGIPQYLSTGVKPLFIDNTTLSKRIEYMNPSWREPYSPEHSMKLFLEAMNYAGNEFRFHLTGTVLQWLPTRRLVYEEYESRYSEMANGHVLVISDSGHPYNDTLASIEFERCNAELENPEPLVLYVVFFDKGRNQWSAKATPVGPNSFESKLPFPKRWRGLRGRELEKVTTVEGALFVHPTGFLCSNRTKEGLFQMIQLSIDLQKDRYAEYCLPKSIPSSKRS